MRRCAKILCLIIAAALFCLFGTASAREWHSADGRRTIEARIVFAEEGTVTLIFVDGKTAKYELSYFSAEDRAFVASFRADAKPIIEATPANQAKSYIIREAVGDGYLCQWGRGTTFESDGVFDGAFFGLIGEPVGLKDGAIYANEEGMFLAGLRTLHPDAGSIELQFFARHLVSAINWRREMGAEGIPDIPAAGLTMLGSGTCFAITNSGYCLTNAHVVKEGGELMVLVGDKGYPATVVAVNVNLDLAVIKSEWITKPLQLMPAGTVSLGSSVFTVGFPKPLLQGWEIKLTKGVISGLSGFKDRGDVYQHDAATQPGNSGGPLLDETGRVVGVVCSILSGKDVQNVNYAVKSGEAREWLKSVPQLNGEPSIGNGDALSFEAAVQMATNATAMILIGSSNPSPSQGVGVQFSISNSGVRHNFKCRHFDASKPCDNSDGRPCKLCGG